MVFFVWISKIDESYTVNSAVSENGFDVVMKI